MASGAHVLAQQRPLLETRIKGLVNNDLKEICKAYGSPVSGTKALLQGRCISSKCWRAAAFVSRFPPVCGCEAARGSEAGEGSAWLGVGLARVELVSLVFWLRMVRTRASRTEGESPQPARDVGAFTSSGRTRSPCNVASMRWPRRASSGVGWSHVYLDTHANTTSSY